MAEVGARLQGHTLPHMLAYRNPKQKEKWKIKEKKRAEILHTRMMLKVFYMISLGLLKCTSYKDLTTKICIAAYDR